MVHNSHVVSEGRKWIAELWIITKLFPSSWRKRNSQNCQCQCRLTHILLAYVLPIPWIVRVKVQHCTDFSWAQVNFLHNSLYNAVLGMWPEETSPTPSCRVEGDCNKEMAKHQQEIHVPWKDVEEPFAQERCGPVGVGPEKVTKLITGLGAPLNLSYE